jgi:hypothetical protein
VAKRYSGIAGARDRIVADAVAGAWRAPRMEAIVRVSRSAAVGERLLCARTSSPMAYGSSSVAGDVGLAWIGLRIIRAMQPSAAAVEDN